MRGVTSICVLLLSSLAAPAQEIALARAAAKIDTAIPWITDGFYATDPGAPVAKLPKISVDRNTLLDEALKRAADEKKLVFWYIPRIEGGHMVRPEFPDEYMRIVAFTNPDITGIINARFVPLRMAIDGPISQRTGIKRVDWVEPAIAILGPDGKILHRLDRIRTFNAGYFHFMLVNVLMEHQNDSHQKSVDTPWKKQVDGQQWTSHLAAFINPGNLAQLRMDLSEKLRTTDKTNPLRAGAMYELAILQISCGSTSKAEEAFREIVADYVDDPEQWPYAAMAAGNLMKGRDTTPVGPAFHNYEDPCGLPEAVFAESRPNTAWSRSVFEMEDVVKRAVAWLLRHQGENGGFEDSRYAYCDTPRILPNVWVAITAIALAGLNDWREVDPKGIDEAIAAASPTCSIPRTSRPAGTRSATQTRSASSTSRGGSHACRLGQPRRGTSAAG